MAGLNIVPGLAWVQAGSLRCAPGGGGESALAPSGDEEMPGWLEEQIDELIAQAAAAAAEETGGA